MGPLNMFERDFRLPVQSVHILFDDEGQFLDFLRPVVEQTLPRWKKSEIHQLKKTFVKFMFRN